MATYAQTNQVRTVDRVESSIPSTLWAAPIGRVLFSLIFVLSGFAHFKSETIAYAASAGVPMANILVPLSGVMAILGGLSIILGYHARIGAILLILFLVPVTFKMHNFWAVADAQMAQMQMAMFMKNISMLGAAVYFFVMGTGPYSLNHKGDRVRRGIRTY